jgi:translation initiation factor 1 (eIF-1/SUI1)
MKDREFGLEKENNHLKEQSNILESEIHKMQTKLLRITQLVSKRNKNVNEIEAYGDGGIDTYDMASDLKQEFNDLSD